MTAESVAFKYLIRLVCAPVVDGADWAWRKKELFRITHHYRAVWESLPYAARSMLLVPESLRAQMNLRGRSCTTIPQEGNGVSP